MKIVLIETSGNQHYIFATNKLRENVGASELTYQIGTKSVLKAVEKTTKKKIWDDDDKDGSRLRANLLDPALNPPIEAADTKIEVIVATSGKAVLLVKDGALAEEIVSEVTKNALIEMPGLTVHGAICEVGREGQANDERLEDIHDAVVRVHHRLENLRHLIPSNQQRFLRLPHVEPCATSGLPASETVKFKNARGEDIFAFSKVTTSKRKALAKNKNRYANDAEFNKGRITNLLETTFDLALPENLEEMEKVFHDLNWLAVIHADGNGLGEIFLKFNEYAKSKGGRDYIDKYRRFSLALDICTINAVGFALKNLQNWFMEHKATNEVPILPLVLGGDDLTVLCDGQFALKFAKDFLTQFEEETKTLSETLRIGDATVELNYLKDVIGKLQDIIPQIVNNAFGNKEENAPSIKHLGICAGVAIVKPHYPFHQAYELAEQLLRSAKQVKENIKHLRKNESGADESVQIPSSALDFRILYDSAHSDLNEIHKKLIIKEQGDKQTHLFAKPYIVSRIDENEIQFKEPEETEKNRAWVKNRKFDEIQKRVEAMTAPAEDDTTRRALPNSKLHEIRQSLFRGKAVADAEVALVKNRLSTSKKSPEVKSAKEIFEQDILIQGKTLFFPESGKNFTHFLDAIEAVEFWKGFEDRSEGGK